MNNNRVMVTLSYGPAPGRTYLFDGSKNCVIGRSGDCDIKLATDVQFANVSRHHCELEIDPPMVRVRDLGSRNGTFVNGEKIERGPTSAEDPKRFEPGEFVPLEDGDEIEVGYARLVVNVESYIDAQTSDLETVYLA